jgi:hypothetical protein
MTASYALITSSEISALNVQTTYACLTKTRLKLMCRSAVKINTKPEADKHAWLTGHENSELI